jgi:hypothetical protein
MSPNKISFGGVLGPLVESLERSQRQSGRLTGQDVVISENRGISAIIALDTEDNIHLLIAPADGDETRFAALDLKGLKIERREWVVSGHPAQTYLDLSCLTGTSPAFRRPFLRFVEDVLLELSRPDQKSADAIYRTGMRWKRFWSVDNSREITSEWLHGLAGELSFLIALIRKVGPGAVYNWSGPLGKDHDFQTGTDLGIEVKASVDIPFKIRCNIRQLDTTLFKKLYVVCFRITPSEQGTNLVDLVDEVSGLLSGDEHAADNFYGKLAAAGYSRELENSYRERFLQISSPSVFLVDDSFPRIAEGSFVTPPDHRISEIHYALQLTGLKELTPNDISSDLEFLK